MAQKPRNGAERHFRFYCNEGLRRMHHCHNIMFPFQARQVPLQVNHFCIGLGHEK